MQPRQIAWMSVLIGSFGMGLLPFCWKASLPVFLAAALLLWISYRNFTHHEHTRKGQGTVS